MAQSLKVIKNRIRSIENTRKVTNALQMISVAKLSNVENALRSLKAYFIKLDLILNRFIYSAEASESAFLAPRPSGGNIGLCVMTSDSGLCGSYNMNLINAVEDFMKTRGQDRIKLILVGRKGFKYFRKKNIAALNSYLGLNGRYSNTVCDELTNNLIEIFVSQKVNEVFMAYTSYEKGSMHRPVIKKILNIEPGGYNGPKIDYIIEPDRERVLGELVPRYIAMKIKVIMLEAFASEHASRAMAMKTATENAKELLEGLILLRNKVRQANITQEILEIISASDALR